MSILQTDNIYLNLDIKNDINSDRPSIRAETELNFTESLLNNPSEFYAAITRFTISTKSLPLYICPIKSGQLQNNRDLTPFTVTLRWANTNFTSPVIFIPQNLYQPFIPLPVPPSQNPPTYTQQIQPDNAYYFVYYFQQIADMFNNALLTSYNNLKAAFPLAPVSFAPYLIWNLPTNKFSLVLDKQMATNQIGPIVSLHCNDEAFNLLDGFDTFYDASLPLDIQYQFILKLDPFNINELFVNGSATTPPSFYIEQLYNNISAISSVKSILFISNSLNCQKEFSPTLTAGQLSGLPILQDFEYYSSESYDGKIQYARTGPQNYRIVDLKSNTPLNKIDLSIFWTDDRGNVYPLYLFRGTYASIKLGFFRKTLYKSFY